MPVPRLVVKTITIIRPLTSGFCGSATNFIARLVDVFVGSMAGLIDEINRLSRFVN